jgi:hypothetical protein
MAVSLTVILFLSGTTEGRIGGAGDPVDGPVVEYNNIDVISMSADLERIEELNIRSPNEVGRNLEDLDSPMFLGIPSQPPVIPAISFENSAMKTLLSEIVMSADIG